MTDPSSPLTADSSSVQKQLDTEHESSRLRSLTRFTVLTLLLLAFVLRVYALEIYPPGATVAEGGTVLDILNLARSGRFAVYEALAISEPLYQIFLAGLSVLIGNTIWAFRFFDVCFGMLSVALVAWVARLSLSSMSRNGTEPSQAARLDLQQYLGNAVTVALLALSLDHIALSRAINQASLQPIFTLFFLGWLLRGLKKAHWPSFIASGVALALTLYSSRAGLAVPGVLVLIGLQALLIRPRAWRKWLPGLLLLVVVFLLAIAPILYTAWIHPQFVLEQVAKLKTMQRAIGWNDVQRLLQPVVIPGDGESLSNLAQAPLVNTLWLSFFIGSIAALLFKLRQPASVLLLGLLGLAIAPMLLSAEMVPELGVMVGFVVLPLLMGMGYAQVVGLLLHFLPQSPRAWRWQVSLFSLLTAFLIGTQVQQTTASYVGYWETTALQPTTRISNRTLPLAEWTFRPDRRDLANWINSQRAPLLLPRDEVVQPTTHAWLAANYPLISALEEPITLPVGTTLVVPWSLELGDLRRETRHYVLLSNHKIQLLPPFNAETHTALLTAIDGAQPLTRTGTLDLMARIRLLSSDLNIAFDPIYPSDTGTEPLARFQPGLTLHSLRGPLTISETDHSLIYTLEWQPLQQLTQFYSSFLQLQTQSGERVAGDEIEMGSGLLATPYWQVNQLMPDVHQLQLPHTLAPGAYKLVAGIYLSGGDWLPMVDADGGEHANSAQLAWVKRPLLPPDPLPEKATPISAIVAEEFALQRVYVSQIITGSIELKLEWRALVSRPDYDATIFVHLVDSAGTVRAQQAARPLDGQYPTFIWDEDEVIVTTHRLGVTKMDGEALQIFVGMYVIPDLRRLDVEQNGAFQADRRIDLGLLSLLLAQ